MAAELTRRSEKGPNNESWFVYFGDVRVGHIGLRADLPFDEHQWGWTCGFDPGCDPEQQTHGTGQTFQEAEAGFEEAWNRLRATRTEAHFELWRQERDDTPSAIVEYYFARLVRCRVEAENQRVRFQWVTTPLGTYFARRRSSHQRCAFLTSSKGLSAKRSSPNPITNRTQCRLKTSVQSLFP